MYKKLQNTRIPRALVLLLLVLMVSILYHGKASAATLPLNTCTETAPGAVTCNLWAKAGTTTLPDGITVDVWGYASTADETIIQPGGPALIVNQGVEVTVNITNTLGEATALLFQGQSMIPDTVGVAPSSTSTYTFTADLPGTYLYEAGLLANGQHQVAMGLYGALIVRPATTGQAYDDTATAYADEALLVLSEIDPALNAAPAAFDMRDFHPEYFLINGKAYPTTDPILVTAGNSLLLRYVNAGLQTHSMSLLGYSQMMIAMDGSPFAYPHRIVAETIAAGQTLDTIVSLPGEITDGSKFPVYDGNMLLRNSSATGFGGMLTFVTVGSTPPPGGDTIGPVTSGVTLNPAQVSGSVDVNLSANVDDSTTGGSTVVTAEYYIDSTVGTGTAMEPVDGSFDSQAEAVQYTIPAATIGTLTTGSHTIYVRGQDFVGNWGAFSSATLKVDKTGPSTTQLTLVPDPSNGSVDVALSATGDDRTSGNNNVVASEYFIDTSGDPGTGSSMTVTPSAPVTNLTATISAATVGGLSEGAHTVSVRSQDALGNWGALSTITLTVDKTGPVTSNLSSNPPTTNGVQGYNSNTPAVRIIGSFNDTLSKVSGAEGFIDSVGANGTGFLFIASNGVFNSSTESGYSDIPLTTINRLTEGPHTILVHAKDSSGNWGATITVSLLLDKTKPTVSGVTATPNPTNAGNGNNTSFSLSATATDPGVSPSGIVAAEWYEGADPGVGNGNAMDGTWGGTSTSVTATIDFVSLGWAKGNHTVYVRAKDAAGSWGTSASVVVNVVYPNNIFTDSFESGTTVAWSSTTGTNLSVTPAANMSGTGTYGLQTTINSGATGYVSDLTPFTDTSYHARFYFSPNGVLPSNNNSANGVTIFSGLNGANTAIFQVQFRRQNAAGGTYQVRLAVLRAGGTSTTSWFNITNAPHAIEIAWQSAGAASARLYTDGTLRQTLTGLNTSAYLLESVRLGPSAGLVSGATGSMYFDAFVSTRNTIVGP